MAGTFPDAWQETCLVSIQKKGQSAQQFAAATETVDISEGDYPGESIASLGGGRIWKQSSKEDAEITLELYPISLNYISGGTISSIDGDGTNITLTTSAAHGLVVGDTVRISNTTNYGTTASPVNYTVSSVTSTTIVVMKSSTNNVEETDGTWMGFKGNTGLFQQFKGPSKSTAISSIDGDADSVDVTSTAHGLVVGDIIEVSGTTNYNGPFVIATVPTDDTFTCTDQSHNVAGETVGFVTKISDAGQPLSTDLVSGTGIDRSRDRFMVAILWTTDTAINSAMDATTDTDKTALRFYAKECRIISHKSSFTDGILKVTATFKYPAYSKDGTTKNDAWQSTDDTDTTPLTALTYT